MVKYFFVLGRNRELSRVEIISYFESRNVPFKEIFCEKSFMVMDFPSADEKYFQIDIQEFGGIVKLGRVTFTGNDDEFEKLLRKDELVPEDKFSFAVFGNLDDYLFYQKFKADRKKAVLKKGRRIMMVQKGDPLHIPNADFSLFAYDHESKIYFGLCEQDYSYAELKERDMKKPVRRQELAISPRLAKILVNLSQVKPGQLLLDPFCGVGGILQEAVLKGINTFGSDKDPRAIVSARENLRWMEKNFDVKGTYQLVVEDVRRLRGVKFDGVASEPALGDLLKKKISDFEARKFIQNFENSIIPALRNLKLLKKNSDSKIVMTFTHMKELGVDFDKICRETGLEVYKFKNHDVHFPIKEFRADQIVSRDIMVFV